MKCSRKAMRNNSINRLKLDLLVVGKQIINRLKCLTESSAENIFVIHRGWEEKERKYR